MHVSMKEITMNESSTTIDMKEIATKENPMYVCMLEITMKENLATIDMKESLENK